MRTITTTAELRSALALLREQGKQDRQRSIGFVPTMGALHEGHRSLVRLSKQDSDITVVSIFVNPTQFGPSEDFERYPRTLEADASLLIEEEVEFLFAPTVDQIYPTGHSTQVHPGAIATLYEGKRRPGHFDGVATVVSILFNIVQPHAAYFGQKDAQQVAIIKKLVRDLAFPVEMVVGPTVREKDGLALSSRNRYLTPADRTEATALSKTLLLVRDLLLARHSVPSAIAEGIAKFHALAPHGILDYLDIVDPETFQPIASFEGWGEAEPSPSGRGQGEGSIIIAAAFGATRLIDNIVM